MQDIKIRDYTISYFNWYYRVYWENKEGKTFYEGHFETLKDALEYVTNWIK